MNLKHTLLPAAAAVLLAATPAAVVCGEHGDSPESQGKYIVEIGGCNDCHTAGYAMSGAQMPEDQWLLGDSLGYRGPWGTTYPANLRTYFSRMSEDEWVEVAKTIKTRPPMPWWALNALKESDSRALYRYINSLGAADNEVPAYVPPTEEPAMPYLQFPAPPE